MASRRFFEESEPAESATRGALPFAVLFVNELNDFMSVEFKDHILVDTTLNQKLPISLNITFPHLRCEEVAAACGGPREHESAGGEVSVDTVDSAGENQIDVHGAPCVP